MADAVQVYLALLVALATIFVAGWLVLLYRKTPKAAAATAPPTPVICPSCGHYGYPRLYDPGSNLVAILLLLLWILPGIIYALWRSSARKVICEACGLQGVIPVNTPRGAELYRQTHESARQAAPAAGR